MYRRGNGRASRVIARRKMITQALSEVTLSVEFRVYLRNLIATSCIGFAVITSHTLYAQAAPNGAVAAAGTLPTVTLTGAEGEKATVSTAEIATLPRKTITVFDAHTKVQETYGGVLLSDLLTRVNAPLGEKLHGKAMTIRVLAEGSDHYTAMYSLAEIDPAFHPGSVIIADTMDGRSLNAAHGPLQLVNTEDKRPARWVRQLVAIRLVAGD